MEKVRLGPVNGFFVSFDRAGTDALPTAVVSKGQGIYAIRHFVSFQNADDPPET